MKLSKMIGTVTLFMSVGVYAMSHESDKTLNITRLSGFQEVPAILTQGKATLQLSLDRSKTQINYSLTFSDLSGTATVAHIHVAQRGVNGAVVAFLCGGGGKPACPGPGVTISGVITATDVIPIPAQGVTGGNLTELLTLIRNDVTYANIHTPNHPAGEIRGQIRGFIH